MPHVIIVTERELCDRRLRVSLVTAYSRKKKDTESTSDVST